MSLIRPDPYHKCDFCGKELRWGVPRYIIKEKYLTGNNTLIRKILGGDDWHEATYKLDMCDDCMKKFRRFLYTENEKERKHKET